MLFSVFENVAKAFTLFPFLDSDRYALAYLGYVCAGICYLLLLLCIAQVVLKMNPHLFYVTSAVVFYILYAMSTILYIPFLGTSIIVPPP
ncbi:MAG: hypothetical protein P4M11_04070 [Candidatus Pacebacteria bacterium]|nr:hypothetical protein [Candidatus Paceibacterota bacterium]